MSIVRARRTRPGVDYWPGFVDALSTLVLSVVFLLTVFVVAQFFLSQQVTDKDTALVRLNRQISELTDLLALERVNRRTSEDQLATLTATLQSIESERERLRGAVASETANATAVGSQVGSLSEQLDRERRLSAEAAARVEALNQQIAALRRQLAAIEAALDAAEARDRDSQTRIADLGSRLNVALAQKVQELARYRSDFFGRLRQILGNRSDIRVVGDRFVFQSEVLFDVGKAVLAPAGQAEMDKLASAITTLEREIPPDIAWILRVDGHTDRRPLSGQGEFKSNWELSAARAIAVVQYLIARGVSPTRLAATGFGEFQPIDLGDSDDANRRNRRIELKLTER
jgi:chemotaxis protein MotB